MPHSESGVVDPSARDKYRLQVTAGPSYDASTHSQVAVNGSHAHKIENDVVTCWIRVRISEYHGLPQNSPPSSNYFDHPMHQKDRYSVGFSFVPKKDIKGSDLVTGFDFDHCIKDRLPPGFKYAMRIVTTLLDPGIYSDPYSDKPYLYGPALSSFFSFRIGEHESEVPIEEQLRNFADEDATGVIEEGADGSGCNIRDAHNIPSKTNKRRKHFLNPKQLENFTFEAGRLYQADNFNPYLDFANFALRIPGFSISVVRYIDDKTHQLRMVLKNRRTEECIFVVVFTLLFGQKLDDTLSAQEERGRALSGQRRPASHERASMPEQEERSSTDSYVTPPSSRSSSPASDSDSEAGRSRQAAVTTLASSIYSGFAALGFGRAASASSSEASSKSTSPERPRKDLNERVDEMHEAKVENYLRGRQTSV